MNYKKIFKSQKIRFIILDLLSWIPDKPMIKLQYRIKLGRKLNLKNPKRYTEKLQWYKLYYKDYNMQKCVDKYEVRSYIKSKGLENILNKLYGVYEKPEDIDFLKLPNKFVVKTTTGSGGQNVYICENKSKLNKKKLIDTLNGWIKLNPKKSYGREWVYDGCKNRIIVEKYLEQPDGDLPDYKFFCFNGKVEYFYKRSGYSKNHDDGIMTFYDKNKNYLKGVGMDYCTISEKAQVLDENIDKMIEISEKLSSDFPHVRVDLYSIKNDIIFGELTFFNASGYMRFIPDSFDFQIGNCFIIDKNE